MDTLSQKTDKITKQLKLKSQAPFLKRQDWLAQPINFYFRGYTKQGTLLGGCFSCCASIFFFVFIVVQLWSWMFQPSFNESLSIHYLPKVSNYVYDIPINRFLPTFAICDSFKDAFVEYDFESCNNSTNWDIWFQ
jgi:hypothetical protein